VPALLDEAGLIHRQHRPRVTQRLDEVPPQVVAHRIGVPQIAVEHALDAPRVAVAGLLGQLPAVLALNLG
jgi:hypothetical protein